MTIKVEKIHNSRRFHRVKEVFCACAEDSKWRPAARVCLIRPIMNLVILSLMEISVLRCTSLTKEKGNCEEMKCICLFYIELARLNEER